MKIFLENKLVEYKDNLRIKDNTISFVEGEQYIPSEQCAYIVPGFIDRHIHGGYGYDFMDEDISNVENLLKSLPAEGTTSVLATTTTMSIERIEKAIENARNTDVIGTKIQGVHLEGPFLNPQKIGAQNPQYVIPCDERLIERNLDIVKMVSYAPELATKEFTKFLSENNIKASCVHSNAKSFEMHEHINYGLDSISHFYNGSSGFSHHEPGVVNCGLNSNCVEVELICDGIHVMPEVIEFTSKVKADKVVLITDSIRAKGLEDGTYELGGQDVIKTGEEVRLPTGSLAGSVLPMNYAVRNYARYSKSIESALYAASGAVSKSLKLEDVGHIREGYKFDIVELDAEFNVLNTYINGIQCKEH